MIQHCQEIFILPPAFLQLMIDHLRTLDVDEKTADGKIKTFFEGRRDAQKIMVRVSNACEKLAASLRTFFKKPFLFRRLPFTVGRP